VPSATLTGMLDVGAAADRGTVLYSADEEPVVAMIGDLPAWRTLEHGVDDGADVRQLEENLAALGYGDDLEVDESFTADTAGAVEAWETDLGRATPDGVVTIGEVVFLTERGDVLGHDASVGDTLEAGSPVMTIGSEQRIVVADVDATEGGGWTSGSRVELEWADGTTSRGTVVGTGREVTDGEVELIVAIGGDDAGAGGRRSGAEATVSLVDARRDGVLAVPVAAIVDDDGSPAVRVAQADGADHTVMAKALSARFQQFIQPEALLVVRPPAKRESESRGVLRRCEFPPTPTIREAPPSRRSGMGSYLRDARVLGCRWRPGPPPDRRIRSATRQLSGRPDRHQPGDRRQRSQVLNVPGCTMQNSFPSGSAITNHEKLPMATLHRIRAVLRVPLVAAPLPRDQRRDVNVHPIVARLRFADLLQHEPWLLNRFGRNQ
jgi:peptidoglycan hydrolase-like protein with peptidoglycan-binding domain